MKYLVPNTYQNECWFCSHQNSSSSISCECCKAHIPKEVPPEQLPGQSTERPTAKSRETIYQIYSFGPRADYYDIETDPRLRAPLFKQCMEILYEKKQVAVRVGDGEKSAIVIHDPNKAFRCSVYDGKSVRAESWEWETQRGAFVEFCEELLSADPAAGEMIASLL